MNKNKIYNWNNPEDSDKIKEYLQNYTRIYPRHYHLIFNGTLIRYFNNNTGDLSKVCVFVKYNKQKNTILVSGFGKYKKMWVIYPDDITIFIEERNIIKECNDIKEKLYTLYKLDLLRIVDENGKIDSSSSLI